MILNKLEFWLMNNPIRRFIQDKVEAKRLRKLSSLPKNKIIMEIGCGNGNGTKLIKKYFVPKEIHAIDLDPRMIKLAKKRNNDPRIFFQVASATKLPYGSNSFDAVIDFGILHHVPNWNDALAEIHRVLKVGGELIMEDLSRETFSTFLGKIYKSVLDHPYNLMYNEEEFMSSLKTLGFQIVKHKQYNSLGLLRYFVIIAQKEGIKSKK